VADASVVPMLTVNPQATIMMLGEKASDILTSVLQVGVVSVDVVSKQEEEEEG